MKQNTVLHYAKIQKALLKSCGKENAAQRYATTVNSLKKYLNGKDISFKNFNDYFLQSYEHWLQSRGLCRNTTSYYMRTLRIIYNRAVEDGLVTQKYPFRHVYTGIDKTVKRALPISYISKMKSLDLHANKSMQFARDMFLFSFYTRGMSMIDIAHLKMRDLRGGTLTYYRQKTSQRLTVQWKPLMQVILDRHHEEGSPYLFPLSSGKGELFRCSYKNTLSRINNQLAKIGVELGSPIPLTTYVARHTWASVAKSINIPISTISEALGHDSEKTTRIYLASIDTSAVDEANDRILSMI